MTTPLSIICDEMNEYINTRGQIPPSTRKTGFLNSWHDLDNQFWLDVFRDARLIHDNTKFKMPYWLENNVHQLENHILKYGEHHPNLLNPNLEDHAKLHKRLTSFSTGHSVKTVLWNTLMNLRERVYNPAMNIDLPNEDSSIGKLNPSIFENMFEWS